MESLFYDTPTGFVEGKNQQSLQSYPVIVMEMVSGGELFHRIKQRVETNQIPSESYLAKIFQTVLLALESIHRRNYIHRDLKLENLLLVSSEEDSPIKIIDFGCMVQLPLGQSVYHRPGEIAGTPGCYAPESLSRNEYSFKSDIWQAGCILYWFVSRTSVLS
jgi:serine/threonine protein kinase